MAANLDPKATDGAVDILTKLYTAYVDGDADLCEINPLILKPTGEVHALDAKVTLDGNAQFRHEGWDVYDATQIRDEREQAAHDKGLQYVGLDGTVGVSLDQDQGHLRTPRLSSRSTTAGAARGPSPRIWT